MHLRHKFEVVAIQKAEGYRKESRSSGTDITLVLRRCKKCSEVKSDYVYGHWTEEQITGKPRYGPDSNRPSPRERDQKDQAEFDRRFRSDGS